MNAAVRGLVALAAAVMGACGPAVSTPDAATSTGSVLTSSGTAGETTTSTAGPPAETTSDPTIGVGSTSSGWEPTNCDPSCQLPPLEERWSFGGADALGSPPESGRDYFFTAVDAEDRTWIVTEQVIPEGSALVSIDPGGRVQLRGPESFDIPKGGVVGIPFTGATESLIVYYSGLNDGSPTPRGLVKLDPNGGVLCTLESAPVVWAEAAQTDTGDWVLLGFDPGVDSPRPAFVGDPCEATAQVYLPLPAVNPLDLDYFDDRFVVTMTVDGHHEVRVYDVTGAEVSTWSSQGNPQIDLVWGASRTPDGRILLTGTHDSLDDGYVIVLAYVELDAGTVSVFEYPGLWEPLDPPRVVVDFDAAEVPWLIFGDRDLRISPLPTEDGEPCCPTVTDIWVPDGLDRTWGLYAVPDGLIAATSTVPEDGGPEDIIVTRFSFAR
jgi:hypothetical protein